MSILIKGMEMPTSCAKCKLFGEYGCPFIGAVGYALTRGERNSDCPLIPVPDHGQLLKVLNTERECVSRDCDRNCGHCDLSMERDEILDAYDLLISMLSVPADKEGEG